MDKSWDACVIAIEFAARSSGTKGPLSQSSIGASLVYAGGLIIGAPFIVLFVLIQQPIIFWRGTIPFSGKHWWPARAKKFGAALTQESNESTLCRMIELRRKKIPRSAANLIPLRFPFLSCGVRLNT